MRHSQKTLTLNSCRNHSQNLNLKLKFNKRLTKNARSKKIAQEEDVQKSGKEGDNWSQFRKKDTSALLCPLKKERFPTNRVIISFIKPSQNSKSVLYSQERFFPKQPAEFRQWKMPVKDTVITHFQATRRLGGRLGKCVSECV